MAKKSMIVKSKRPPKYQGAAAQPLPASAAGPAAICASSALCRICFRELALRGELPGVTKASW